MGTDDINAVFETVARGIEPDLRDVIDRAMRQGLRRRGRRRATIAAGAMVSVAVIATGVTMGARLGPRSALGASPAWPDKASHAQHPRHHKPKSHQVPQANGPGMYPWHMLAILRPMLPPGRITYIYYYRERGSMEINFNDGYGAVDIMLWIQPSRDIVKLACPKSWAAAGYPRPADGLPLICVMRKLPDGSIERDMASTADPRGYYGYLIHVQRSDGVTVAISVANGTLGGTPHPVHVGWFYVDRARPPGSMALWASIAESPKWHL